MSELLPFYPSQRYRDKKLAPETIDSRSVVALANAAKMARAHGLLRDDVINLMLPNMMTENRADDYGVNTVELKGNRAKTIPQKLGLVPTFDKVDKVTVQGTPWRTGSGEVNIDKERQLVNAKLAVAALIQKQDTADRITGTQAPGESVIKLWNGQGPGAENHVRKVKEADAMIRSDPINSKIKALWDSIVGTLPSKQIKSAAEANRTSQDLEIVLNDDEPSTQE